MLFSERKDLENEYHEWLEEVEEANYVLEDCAFNVITFLDSLGYLKEKKIPKRQIGSRV
jgi:hypothetical protein